jgi:hypothetical protein
MICLMMAEFADIVTGSLQGKYSRARWGAISCEPFMSLGIMEIRRRFIRFKTHLLHMFSKFRESEVLFKMQSARGLSVNWTSALEVGEYLLEPCMMKLVEPSNKLVDEIADVLMTLISRVTREVFARFPAVTDYVLEMSAEYIRDQVVETRRVVDESIACARGYPVSLYCDVCMGTKQMGLRPDVTAWANKSLADGVRHVGDTVTKTIGFLLIRRVQEELVPRIQATLRSSDFLSKWIAEPERLCEERKKLEGILETISEVKHLMKLGE